MIVDAFVPVEAVLNELPIEESEEVVSLETLVSLVSFDVLVLRVSPVEPV